MKEKDIHKLFEDLLKSHDLLNNYDTQLANMTSPSISKKHPFYTNLIHYFTPMFHIDDNEIINDLSFATYLYFKGVRELDSFFDEKEIDSPLRILKYRYADVFIFESLSLFGKYFTVNHLFWGKYKKLKKEFLDGLFLTITLNKHRIEFTKEIYLKLAAKKNIFVCIPVLALASYEDDWQNYKKLIDSLLELHTAIQVFDDVLDIKEDLSNGNLTYPIAQLSSYLAERDIKFPKDDPKKLLFHFYYSGIAIENIELAENKLIQSIEIVRNLPVDEYKAELKNMLADFKETRQSVIDSIKSDQYAACN